MTAQRMQELAEEIESGKVITLFGYSMSSVAELERVCQYPAFKRAESKEAEGGEAPVAAEDEPTPNPKSPEAEKEQVDEVGAMEYGDLKELAGKLGLVFPGNIKKSALAELVRAKQAEGGEALVAAEGS